MPAGKGIPHRNYLVPLIHKARWAQHAVYAQLAKDFGQPQRKWPKDLGERVIEIADSQLRLGLE